MLQHRLDAFRLGPKVAALALAFLMGSAASAQEAIPPSGGALQDQPGALNERACGRFSHRPCASASEGQAVGADELPGDLSGIVKDEAWAKILGKALFWDTVAGADTACAGCHFNAAVIHSLPDRARTDSRVRQIAASDLDVCSPAIQQGPRALSDSSSGASIAPTRSSLPFAPVVPPALSSLDPSCQPGLSARLARALLEHRPLDARTIHPHDPLFGSDGPHGNLISGDGRGLDRTYFWLIQQAFEASVWSGAPGRGNIDTTSSIAGALPPSVRGNTALEESFPLIWVISIRLYESTLSVDPSRFHTCRPRPGADLTTCQEQLTPVWALPKEAERTT